MTMTSIREKVEEVLGAFWDEREIAISSDPSSINDLGAPMDSLTACEAMIDIDVIVGKKIPAEVVIQNGGYSSRDEFIQLVTDGVLAYLKDNE